MDTKSFHLGRQPAPEGILKGVAAKGEFHAITQSASEALLAGGAATDEIHLKSQCAPEGLLKGVSPKGEFHRVEKPDRWGNNLSQILTDVSDMLREL